MKHNINTAFLDVLGIPWRDKDILGVTLRMRGGRLPTLTVHRMMTNKTKVGEVIERFELTPISGVKK